MHSLILPFLLTGLAYAIPAPQNDSPCPTMTFTYDGSVFTEPYTGPGTPQSCLTPANAPTPTPSTPAPAPASPTASASPAPLFGVVKGFNYGSQGMTQQIFQTQFSIASNLVGAPGFTAARLYTMIQDGTTNTPISAIPAAIATKTKLLLGLYYGNNVNEIAALKSAIQQYGTEFTDLVLAISVGSEDLYRNSPTGIENGSDQGANPADIVSFIQATRQAIVGTSLASTMVGHVDTWTAYVNASNTPVIEAIDFLGMDAYPYYQNTEQNDITKAASLFESAYQATVNVAQGKPVWITETGWPASGPNFGDAVASTSNAETYWQEVGCGFSFNQKNTFWFNLVDEGAIPSWGVTDGGQYPNYVLSCS